MLAKMMPCMQRHLLWRCSGESSAIPDGGPQRVTMINDVRRAYFYAQISRDVYIELPKEDPKYGTGLLGKLKLCIYGTRDATEGWQA